ncbi:GNAT family N-acetyltransferase [Paenibacillus glucanolyticus]|uniref:GNAT family N-acetyltransferase n=1 Tax=Paenibacillus glucanolyticus TaxID=59843 RepID=UPI00128C57C9|nr:GNAT family N-acetyltransferase [Paenibacillus glucanolyticus]MPY17412.1 GNAT family N-acetyltransferase [Paenibacillus glucanolyticus]
MEIILKVLDSTELKCTWKEGFQQQHIHRSEEYYNLCEFENQIGIRVTMLAFVNDKLAGVAHLKYESDYPYFRDQNIPEINDLNVFPEYRRNGVANRIIEQFETIVSKKLPRIGIGVGLYKDYGPAQRIYARRGYIPDGNGIMYNLVPVVPGEMVCADDDLNLYLIKELGK